MLDAIEVVGDRSLSNSFLGDTRQVATVTPDLYRTLDRFAQLGFGPWRIHTFTPENTDQQTYYGKAEPHAMKLAVAWTGSSFWEVIQPLSGRTIYQDWLDKHGESLHHVCQTYGDLTFEEKVAECQSRGLRLAQTGRWMGAVRYAYFDALDSVGFYLEASDLAPGFVPPEPEEWHPGPPPARSA